MAPNATLVTTGGNIAGSVFAANLTGQAPLNTANSGGEFAGALPSAGAAREARPAGAHLRLGDPEPGLTRLGRRQGPQPARRVGERLNGSAPGRTRAMSGVSPSPAAIPTGAPWRKAAASRSAGWQRARRSPAPRTTVSRPGSKGSARRIRCSFWLRSRSAPMSVVLRPMTAASPIGDWLLFAGALLACMTPFRIAAAPALVFAGALAWRSGGLPGRSAGVLLAALGGWAMKDGAWADLASGPIMTAEAHLTRFLLGLGGVAAAASGNRILLADGHSFVVLRACSFLSLAYPCAVGAYALSRLVRPAAAPGWPRVTAALGLLLILNTVPPRRDGRVAGGLRFPARGDRGLADADRVGPRSSWLSPRRPGAGDETPGGGPGDGGGGRRRRAGAAGAAWRSDDDAA